MPWSAASASRVAGVACPPTRTAAKRASATRADGSATSVASWLGTSETKRSGASSRSAAARNAAAVNGPSATATGMVPAAIDRASTLRPAT